MSYITTQLIFSSVHRPLKSDWNKNYELTLSYCILVTFCRRSADTKHPKKHPRRNHGSLESIARHQNQPPFSSSPFSTHANNMDIPHLLQSSHLTSSTSAVSSGLPFYQSTPTSIDYPHTIPFEHLTDTNSLDHHPDRDFGYHHPDRDSFDHHPDTNSLNHHSDRDFGDQYPNTNSFHNHQANRTFDLHLDTIPFDYHCNSEPFAHPDNISFDHHSDINSFSHQDTNSHTFGNLPDPSHPLPPPRPSSESTRTCDIKMYLLRKVVSLCGMSIFALYIIV